MNKYMEEAKAIRAGIDNLTSNQNDETIIENKAVFPWWNGDGIKYLQGMILQYNDSAYRVLQSHTSQNDWAPDVAVSLFTKISLEKISDWVQPGSTNPYMKNDKVYFESHIYQSLIDFNVWSPSVYPQGWTFIE